MLTLEGQLLNVAAKPFTDKKTGEIAVNYTAQILDTATNGDCEIAKLKLDQS